MGKKDNTVNYEGNGIHRISGKYEGEDIFVMGTGTSLAGFPWEKMNDKITIALNDAVKVKGFIPTYHLFSDVNIWKRYSNLDWPEPCKMVCQRHARKMFLDSRHCKFKNFIWQFDISCVAELKKEDQRLHVRRTVATGGINFAYKLGAKRIFLMGVDGYKYHDKYYHDGSSKPVERRRTKEIVDNDGSKRLVQDRHEAWKNDMNAMAKELKTNNLYPGPYPESGVYNLSPLSTIESWEKVKAEEVLGFSW